MFFGCCIILLNSAKKWKFSCHNWWDVTQIPWRHGDVHLYAHASHMTRKLKANYSIHSVSSHYYRKNKKLQTSLSRHRITMIPEAWTLWNHLIATSTPSTVQQQQAAIGPDNAFHMLPAWLASLQSSWCLHQNSKIFVGEFSSTKNWNSYGMNSIRMRMGLSM